MRQGNRREDAVTTTLTVGATAPPSTHSASSTRKLRLVLGALLLVCAAGSGGVLSSAETLAQNAYITNNQSNYMSVIDTVTNQVTPDGRKVHVANYAADTVTVIDGMTYAILGTIPVGSDPLAFGIFIQPAPKFAGTPRRSNCQGQSVSALARQYGGLNNAAAALGFDSVNALQGAIQEFCGA
jgi:YVTN family beta-propeller protein